MLFVTGGSGFIGREVVRQALAAGKEVFALARSERSAAAIRAAGAEPVMGDLLVRGDWCDTAARADEAVHVAQPDAFGARVTRQRAAAYRTARLQMDAHLFGALLPERARRVVYVGGTSYYGELGQALANEDSHPNPRGWGPYVAAAFERLADYRALGFAIVEAFPGWVYGPGSWFSEYLLRPLLHGKKLTNIAGPPRWMSAVHVDDCARAILHLSRAGEPGKRYFIVDDEPLTGTTLSELAAECLGVAHRMRTVPAFICRWLVGPVITDSLLYSCRLSNKRLRDSGFTLRFPTVRDGVPDVVAKWTRKRAERFAGYPTGGP